MPSKALDIARLLIATQLNVIGEYCFGGSNLEIVIGDNISTVEEGAFSSSHFLSKINLRNAKYIGKQAFDTTQIKQIKNHCIEYLDNY